MKKKFIFCLISIFITVANSFADDWILAAKKFEFSQDKKRDASEEELSFLIPQLMLEQISSGLIRNTSSKEMMDRTLNAYLVERQSLFLQLSKDYKKRDSLVLTTSSKKKLKKALENQQKAIKETEDKIEENLDKTERLRNGYRNLVEKESSGTVVESDFNLFFNPLTNLFVKKEEKLLDDTRDEKISLYKNDSAELYSPGTAYKTNGPESRSFEKEVTEAKINGMIDGTITVYGEYFSVTCSLYIYPGKERLGTVTEVGKVRNAGKVAANLSSFFCPLITNHGGIEVYFEIQPAEIIEKTHVTVDGVYHENVPEKLILDSGKHTVKVECPGYYSRMISYEFTGANKFVVQADMMKEKKSDYSVVLLKPEEGKIYADGKFAGEILSDNYFGKITSGGEPVIGHFLAKRKDNDADASFFYYVPENLQVDGNVLAVNAKAMNHEAYIEKRRIWTYRAYTLLVLSMPFTLYYTGQYNSSVYAFNSGSMKDLGEVYRLKEAKNRCLCITAVCTGFFIVELVRYLVAANSVLPANAHKESASELKKAEIRAGQMLHAVENPSDNDENVSAEKNESDDSAADEMEVDLENKVPGETE